MWHLKAWHFVRWRGGFDSYKVRVPAAVANNYWQLNQLDSAKAMIDTSFYYQNLYQIDYEKANRYYIFRRVQQTT